MKAAKALLLGAVRGLTSEGARVISVAEKLGPDAVAMSVSREGLEAMGGMSRTSLAKSENFEEGIYIRELSKYGKVAKPPPCFFAVQEWSRKSGLPVMALDMNDRHYTAAYCKYVSTMDIMRQGGSKRSLSRHKFKARTPEELVIEWDRMVNRLDGYRTLEMARERWIAKGICKLTERYGKPLVIIEMERLRGVCSRLAEMGCDFEIV